MFMATSDIYMTSDEFSYPLRGIVGSIHYRMRERERDTLKKLLRSGNFNLFFLFNGLSHKLMSYTLSSTLCCEKYMVVVSNNGRSL